MPNPQLRSVVNATLLALMRTPLDVPLKITCNVGEGQNLLLSMRVKLSRERQHAEKAGVKFTDFYLANLAIETNPKNPSEEFLFCVRTLTKKGRREEYSFLREMHSVMWRDRHALLDKMERDSVAATNFKRDDVRTKQDDLLAKKNAATFNAIVFVEGVRKSYEIATGEENAATQITGDTSEETVNAFSSYEDDFDESSGASEPSSGNGKAVEYVTTPTGKYRVITPDERDTERYGSGREFDGDNPFGNLLDEADSEREQNGNENGIVSAIPLQGVPSSSSGSATSGSSSTGPSQTAASGPQNSSGKWSRFIHR